MRPGSLDRDLFDRLALGTGDALASVYLPTHVKGAEIEQDRIRLKNALAVIDDWLDETGWSRRDRTAHLEEASSLLDDREFWENQAEGLAVLIDDGVASALALPRGVVERTVLSSVFHLRPMFPSLEAGEATVLAISRHGARLYQVSTSEALPIEADLPRSVDDVNWFTDREKERQRHPDRAGTKRARHGHDPSASRDEDLDRYLRAIDEALDPDLPGPLIVVGDESIGSRFARISDQEVAPTSDGAIGDVDDIERVLRIAGEVIEDQERMRQEEIQARAEASLGTGDAITDLSEALEAAVAGRIAFLLLGREAPPAWGKFDPATLEVATHDTQAPHDDDLIDRLAIHSMASGAEVETIDEKIDGHDFIAELRF